MSNRLTAFSLISPPRPEIKAPATFLEYLPLDYTFEIRNVNYVAIPRQRGAKKTEVAAFWAKTF
jgi:hypothetical protein